MMAQAEMLASTAMQLAVASSDIPRIRHAIIAAPIAFS